METQQVLTDGINIKNLKIAQDYLAKHPRRPSYLVTFKGDIDVSEGTTYLNFTEQELKVLKDWNKSEERLTGGCSLTDYLLDIGLQDLLENIENEIKYFIVGDPTIIDCDINDKLYFTPFTLLIIDNNGNIKHEQERMISLTDDEYCVLLAMHLEQEDLTFNKFTYLKPQLALRIIRNIIYIMEPYNYVYSNPFVVFMDEFKNIAKAIKP